MIGNRRFVVRTGTINNILRKCATLSATVYQYIHHYMNIHKMLIENSLVQTSTIEYIKKVSQPFTYIP